MSDYIDNQNEIFDKIQQLYENNRKTLIFIQEELQNKFEEILELHTEKYNLIAKKDFSVNPTKYYHLKSRVKTLHSFREKLYRKNLGLQIINIHQLSLNNFKKNHLKIKKTIFLFDDIIGLRIVTELKHDCKFVYELLNNENHFFLEKDIVFNIDELKNQPETMKNGLPIFRIKGVYKEEYGFELQIKSKIDEAWGDMDHSLFYKDYSVSPIKNTVQITMNNVGHLFDKVEDLLFGLRNSEINYKEKEEEIDFLHELSGSVFNELKNKLGDNYDLSNIASSIKYIKTASKVKNEDAEVKNLNFSFLNYAVKEEITTNYINCRNVNFELIILESLYWYWQKKSSSSLKLSSRNYERNLKLYINVLINNMCNNVKNISKLSFLEISINKVYYFVSAYNGSDLFKPFYLDPKTLYKLIIVDTLLNDPINEYFEDSNFNDPSLIEILKAIYFHNYFKIDINELMVIIEDMSPDFIELNEFNNFIYKINDKIQLQLNSYKIDENYETLKEVKFVEKLLVNVLKSVNQLN